MCLDDVDSRMEHDVEWTLLGHLVRDRLGAWLQGLFVDEDPEAVLSILEEVWEHGDDEDAVHVGWEIDSARVLHFMGEGEYIQQNWVAGLHIRMELDTEPGNQSIFDTWDMVRRYWTQ